MHEYVCDRLEAAKESRWQIWILSFSIRYATWKQIFQTHSAQKLPFECTMNKNHFIHSNFIPSSNNKLRWRMIHSKQPNCLGRGPLLKHEICRINPMAAGVMWYCCQTHPALVVNFIMTSYTILLKVYPTWIGKFIMTCYGCDDILAKCVTLRWN